jgi:hypothetical protein
LLLELSLLQVLLLLHGLLPLLLQRLNLQGLAV